MIKRKKQKQVKGVRSNQRVVSPFLAVSLAMAVCGGLTPGLLRAESFSRTNKTSISITDVADYTPATPYPSTISVSGLTQQVAHVSVTLWGLAHDYSPELSILLVGPQGQSVVLMSQAGEGQPLSLNWLTFDDSASVSLPFIGRFWTRYHWCLFVSIRGGC